MLRVISAADYRADKDNKDFPETGSAITAAVKEIIANVINRGDEALREYTLRFDGCALNEFKVTESEINVAFKETELVKTMERAARNIEDFHRPQLNNGYVLTRENGAVLGMRVLPIERAGIYIPGGTASYPSTVLMNAVPAKLAGVSDIVMTTPPNKDGSLNPVVLAAAKIAGVNSIYKVGGAQAVAALAYGTKSIPRADKITGPGNDYVAEAKRQVFGVVGIDMIAGPSDVLIIADKTANHELCAADILAQSEHGVTSRAILITDCKELAEKTAHAIEARLKILPREKVARAAIDNYGKIILTDDIEKAFALSNEIAPEHLEIMTENPMGYLGLVKNAGSVFLGNYSPEALGDYCAGPNHTLPTSGTARFSSPLSVDDFVKKISFTHYTKKALSEVSSDITAFAEAEGLHAHGESAAVREKLL